MMEISESAFEHLQAKERKAPRSQPYLETYKDLSSSRDLMHSIYVMFSFCTRILHGGN